MEGVVICGEISNSGISSLHHMGHMYNKSKVCANRFEWGDAALCVLTDIPLGMNFICLHCYFYRYIALQYAHRLFFVPLVALEPRFAHGVGLIGY